MLSEAWLVKIDDTPTAFYRTYAIQEFILPFKDAN